MTPFNTFHGWTIIMSVIAAIAIFATNQYANAWIYILIIWAILFAAFEVYYSHKNRKNR